MDTNIGMYKYYMFYENGKAVRWAQLVRHWLSTNASQVQFLVLACQMAMIAKFSKVSDTCPSFLHQYRPQMTEYTENAQVQAVHHYPSTTCMHSQQNTFKTAKTNYKQKSNFKAKPSENLNKRTLNMSNTSDPNASFFKDYLTLEKVTIKVKFLNTVQCTTITQLTTVYLW